LQGSEYSIEVWTDYINLRAFTKQPRLNGRQARWLIMLAPYDFTIHHRPGDRNPANGPSRRPNYVRQVGIETENDPALNRLLPILTSKLVNQHKLDAE